MGKTPLLHGMAWQSLAIRSGGAKVPLDSHQQFEMGLVRKQCSGDSREEAVILARSTSTVQICIPDSFKQSGTVIMTIMLLIRPPHSPDFHDAMEIGLIVEGGAIALQLTKPVLHHRMDTVRYSKRYKQKAASY